MNETFMKEKPVLPLLVSMALPNVISMLVNSLYNIVRQPVLWPASAEDAMTALSLVFPIQNFANAIAIGFGIGINAMIALLPWRGRPQKGPETPATHGMALSLMHGILITIVSIVIMPGFFPPVHQRRRPDCIRHHATHHRIPVCPPSTWRHWPLKRCFRPWAA
ncbi:hypothetical protein ACKXF4_00315 [Faecalibacterium prausnitzii]|uniref:hypothetical protein n=1 Tax=Faecalibacterium prausnitzii TaxID=853 RepID=UPI003AAC4858